MWENVRLPQEPDGPIRREALDGPLLFLDREFGLAFLENAFSICGKEFHFPCLLLDRLAAAWRSGPNRGQKILLCPQQWPVFFVYMSERPFKQKDRGVTHGGCQDH